MITSVFSLLLLFNKCHLVSSKLKKNVGQFELRINNVLCHKRNKPLVNIMFTKSSHFKIEH